MVGRPTSGSHSVAIRILFKEVFFGIIRLWIFSRDKNVWEHEQQGNYWVLVKLGCTMDWFYRSKKRTDGQSKYFLCPSRFYLLIRVMTQIVFHIVDKFTSSSQRWSKFICGLTVSWARARSWLHQRPEIRQSTVTRQSASRFSFIREACSHYH